MLDKIKYASENEAREAICHIGKRMYERNYVAANDGNISIKIKSDEIICTPTGVSKGFMTPDILVKISTDGRQLSGSLKPSSEIKMHLKVYEENAEVQGITHAHPPIATSFAVAGIALEKPILPEAIILLGKVPLVPYARPGTEEVPDSIAPYCKEYKALLLENHGALTWGKNIREAFHRMEALEHYARITMYTTMIIGKAKELNEEQVEALIEMRKNFGL